MNHLDYPANCESPIANPLYCIRLRHDVPRYVSGRWVHVSVKRRAENQARELARTKRQPWHPKRWQPLAGRESPREDWMSWRSSLTQYAYPGWMRFKRGKAPALVGRKLLYCLTPE